MAIALAASIVLACTLVLTIAGLGAAFVLIPVFLALGMELHGAMALALLLNAIAMAVAAVNYQRRGLIDWHLALPMMGLAGVMAPLGVRAGQALDHGTLLWCFIAFLTFAAAMLLLYTPRSRQPAAYRSAAWGLGLGVGAAAGFIGGLIGVGGGNIVVPSLILLGLEPRRASATSTLVIIAPSLTGFLAQAGIAHLDTSLVALTGVAALVGAGMGSWIASTRLRSRHLTVIIACVLLLLAGRMAWERLATGPANEARP